MHPTPAPDRPLIGLTTYGRDENNRYYCPAEYVDAVRRAGAAAVLLPPGDAEPAALLARLDGVVFVGGGDINPRYYAADVHPTVYSIDNERDEHEFALARHVLDCGLPTFGICRGLQVFNVLLGGTLHQHLPDVYGDALQHRAPPREPTAHRILIRHDTRLAQIVGTTEMQGASWHHQGIERLAAGFVVSATAPDGLVEAVELPGHPWLVAVQWHPELTAATDALQHRLFEGFITAARAVRAPR
ncbi:MAG: gamma-glutamyl-gamma-aminobutyrate hydrolase family protein [Gammaproteobacteria bacterium]